MSRAENGARPTTEDLLAQQHATLRDQDSALDELESRIAEVRGVAGVIGETAELHTRLLGDITDEVDEGARGISRETGRLGLVQKRADTRSLWYIIFVLAAIFVLMVILKL